MHCIKHLFINLLSAGDICGFVDIISFDSKRNLEIWCFLVKLAPVSPNKNCGIIFTKL